MCKASLDNPNAPDANIGDAVGINTNFVGMGSLHRAPSTDSGDATMEDDHCLVCVHTGAVLALTAMPQDIRDILGVGSAGHLNLTFIETPGSHDEIIHDLVVIQELPEFGQLPLAVFDGCMAELIQAPRRGEIAADVAIGADAEIVRVTDEDPVEMLRRIASEVGEGFGGAPAYLPTERRVPA